MMYLLVDLAFILLVELPGYEIAIFQNCVKFSVIISLKKKFLLLFFLPLVVFALYANLLVSPKSCSINYYIDFSDETWALFEMIVLMLVFELF